MQHRLTVPMPCAGFLLAACGGEPSDASLLEAIKKQADAENKATGAFADQRAAQKIRSTVHGVRKIACKQADKKSGYQCDIEIDVEGPLIGRTKQNASTRFVKGDSGWLVFEQ